MSDKNPEEILEELDEVFADEGVWDDYSEEIDAYIGSHGLEDPGQTEYNVAKEISREAPELLDIGAEIYTSASALKFYEFEGELPDDADIILKVPDLGAGEGRRYEHELDTDYNVSVRGDVNPIGLRRII